MSSSRSSFNCSYVPMLILRSNSHKQAYLTDSQGTPSHLLMSSSRSSFNCSYVPMLILRSKCHRQANLTDKHSTPNSHLLMSSSRSSVNCSYVPMLILRSNSHKQAYLRQSRHALPPVDVLLPLQCEQRVQQTTPSHRSVYGPTLDRQSSKADRPTC
jgi:hypothetical protein